MEAGIGIVIRNKEGNVMVGASKKVNVKTCLETEDEAMKERLRLVKMCGFQKIVLHTDSEILDK